jgi:hypothetical protein
VQNINPPPKLHRRHHAVGIRGVAQGELKNAAADALEGLGIFRHSAELDQLQLVPKQFLGAFRKTLKVLPRFPSQTTGRSTGGLTLSKPHLINI